MRFMFALILIVGMGLAGFAVYMAQGQFSKYQNEQDALKQQIQQNVTTVQVFVADKPLRYGQQLEKTDVRLVFWPEDAIPEGAFVYPTPEGVAPLFDPNTSDLRAVIRAMEKDEALMAVKVTEPGQEAGITSRLTPGKRAFTIRVDVATGVSGFLRPGDAVDVYWAGRLQSGRDVTKLILEDIQIIAIDQISDEDRNHPVIARTITVEVSPTVVAALAQAQSTGQLLLSLRGAEDEGVAETAIETDQNQLLGIEEETVAPVITEQRVCTIRTRKGSEVVEIPVECPRQSQ